ncbi:MAG: DUF1059 domain-containing protein [Candidatus Wildermuthbacteria bacterium]|nr:DUF1059 domain-containing protein [Candidatus Wildermuthbacteria bacterium]
MKEITCPCGEKIMGENEDEVMEKSVRHGMEAHGMTEEESKQQGEELRRLIKDSEE